MVQQQEEISNLKDVVRSRTMQRSPTPESLQYGGGDSSYGSNSTGHAPMLPHPQCCCGSSAPGGGSGSTGSDHPGGGRGNSPGSSGGLFQQPSHFCPGCSSSSASSTGSTNTVAAGPASGGGGNNNNNNNIATSVKFELGRIEVCEGCGLGIADRYVMRVADGSWHEDCLVCCVCHAPLVHSCFTRSGRVYCRQDYDRVYGAKCGRCNERLYPHELVMRAGSSGLAFHLPCFGCFICGRPLQKGDQFVVRAGQLLCRADLEKDLFLIQSSANNNNGEDSAADENNRPRHDGRRGPKRPRTILTSAQRRQFKASFEISPKPCRKVREALAKETGLSVRVVQVWFQNQRAKMKKLQRKAKIEAEKNGGSSGSQSSGNNGDKNSKDSKGDKKRFGDNSDGHGGNSSLMSSMPYSPNGDDSYVGHSGDSMCGSDLSLDDSGGFDQMDDGHSLSGVDLQDVVIQQPQQQQPPPQPTPLQQHPGLIQQHPVLGIHQQQQQHPSMDVSPNQQQHHPTLVHHHQLHPQQHPAELMAQSQLHPTPIVSSGAYHPINPIDKLYLMQNAYFRLDQ